MRERIDRLMKQKDDGSYEVVGYQWQIDGQIFHGKDILCGYDILLTTHDGAFNYITHDRVDQLTGIEILKPDPALSDPVIKSLVKGSGKYDVHSAPRIKVFERDMVLLDNTCRNETCEVYYADGSFQLRDKFSGGLYLSAFAHRIIKITGIQGVTK